MNEFLQTALTFPTVVYSVLLAVCVVFWLIATTGLVDTESADALVAGDGGVGDLGGAAAMLARVGLAGIPVMVVVTALAFTAWFGTYFVQLLALRHLPDTLRTAAGIATLVAVLVPSIAATAVLLRPLRRMLARQHRAAQPALLGLTGIVTTPVLTADRGQAAVEDGGAGLILQVRHHGPEPLARGDRVVLVDYIEGQHAYRVVPEHQFLGLSEPTPHERLSK